MIRNIKAIREEHKHEALVLTEQIGAALTEISEKVEAIHYDPELYAGTDAIATLKMLAEAVQKAEAVKAKL